MPRPLLLVFSLVATMLHLSPVQSAAVTPDATIATGEVAGPPVTVAVGNVHEGAAVLHRFDKRNGADRTAFARRVLDKRHAVPDIVLVQEVRGTAHTVAATLTRHPRAQRGGARYVVAVPPRIATQRGPCGGARTGKYTVLRDSAILVNATTVPSVHETGVVRTWGRWAKQGSARIGNSGYGCAEQPWARVTVEPSGAAPRTVRVLSAHVAPLNGGLKTTALRQLAAEVTQMQVERPSELVVMGSDLNQTRCRTKDGIETADCAVRPGHEALHDAGLFDAVRERNLSGPNGVVGLQRRIDFVHTNGPVIASGFDRCYLAFWVKKYRCGTRAVFPAKKRFFQCQKKSLTGRGACPRAEYRRYYSDHPVMHATLG